MLLTVAVKAPLVAYPALIAAALVNGDENTSPVEFSFVDTETVEGTDKATVSLKTEDATVEGVGAVLEYVSKTFPHAVVSNSDTAHWVNFALTKLAVKDFKTLTPSLETLESHLNFRSFVVGYRTTVADVAVWGVLRSNSVVASVVKNGTYVNIARWFLHFDGVRAGSRYFGQTVESVTKAVNEQRKQSKVGQKKEASKASFDIDLIDAEDGKVVTRFPPEPSGYLHIGHAKAAILNQYFARQYHGQLIVRFDDTNPSKEKVEFEDAIVEDLALLGIKADRVTHSSDSFDKMYELAVQIIKDGKAYCDDTPTELMREQRGDGVASARRDRSVEENLQIFTEEMRNGTEEGLKNCLRAKISVDNPNKAMRDPVIYRCNLTPHHRTGTTWKLYPTYDFCAPILDALEGVTHALRTNEYRDRNPQYDWMLKALGLRKVHIWDFSRINFVRTLLSKRKLQWFVDNGKVTGWDDPRFPTVRGVRRRGMTVEALQAFIISQGPSRNILNLEWSTIWAFNKKVIDPVVPRFTAIVQERAVPVTLAEGPATAYKEDRPKHKKNADLGSKPVVFGPRVLIDQADAVTLADGEEFTLMDWGNAIVQTIHRDADGHVTAIDARLHLAGDFRKTDKKLTWLAQTDDLADVDLVDFDHLITKDKIEDGENFEDFLTPEAETETHCLAYGDLNLRTLKAGDIFQLERKGYYIVDRAWTEAAPALLFTIPDGKQVQRYGAK